ncbi:JAB domain-containing protein [Parahaliea mediterranea]|uniref:DNA repair protein RadC n=1 Tax=Parahaliea mediterranea TaxID=651086 RepID=A0A939IJ62_9GAMM|nr:JAB domain-containing protein [Parahaliea mediterranea]MBN7795946.1 DNA repair protein RadC [Parahaliea mediterranea]
MKTENLPAPHGRILKGLPFNARHQATIREAVGILESHLQTSPVFTHPNQVNEYCQLQLAGEADEVFCCLYLDTQHRLLNFEQLFRGTIDSAHIHERVILRRCLEVNAASLIVCHNHPSGSPEPSNADIHFTAQLKFLLAMIDVRLMDHIIVGAEGHVSMAQADLLNSVGR